ncbi:hypothetical protein NQ318_002588 [Aromia moschata]|uniref:Uncharacterized protein n=1 Tax=Aromia moschata TaxID=1265417 RepID=A0AAV8XWC9_9CUCU|nr:hypothetical protein NQ318_002588 [Aromia moschata]
MLEALTTAPERPYSPLIVESVGMEVCKASTETQQTKSIDRSQLYKPLKPDVLPASFQMNKKEPKPPSYYSPSVLYQRTTEEKTEEHTEESDTSQTRTIERQTIHNPQTAQVIVENEDESPHHFAPVFQAVSCFYQNKKNNFSVEISTSPVILTPPPKAPTPAVKIIESKPGYIEKETITEEKRAHQQKKTKEQRVVEEERGVIQATAKQAEEVIQKKARPPVMLHKPEGLPSYQVQLSENAEADLLLMEKMEKAQSRLEQQKVMRSQQSHQQEIQRKQIEQQQIVEQRKQQLGEEQRQQRIVEQQRQTAQQQQVRFQEEISKQQAYQCQYQQRAGSQHVDTLKKPIITIQPDESVPGTPQTTFQPVIEDRSPILLSLVRLPHAPEGRSRSPSPFPSAAGRGERAVSPAAGPPPNPLKSSKPLPTPRDSKIAQARENISTYIPEYKSKRDLIEKVQGMGCYTKSEETQQSQTHQTQAQQSQIRQSCMQQSRAQQNQTLQSHDQRAQVQQRQA